MDLSKNRIDFTFLDRTEKDKDTSTVLVVLNRPIVREMFEELKSKVDFIICADGAANRMYDDLDKEE